MKIVFLGVNYNTPCEDDQRLYLIISFIGRILRHLALDGGLEASLVTSLGTIHHFVWPAQQCLELQQATMVYIYLFIYLYTILSLIKELTHKTHNKRSRRQEGWERDAQNSGKQRL